jgi:hypothetical protein
VANHVQLLLQQKVFEILSADAGIIALVGVRVYDWVPDNAPKPYIALGSPVALPFGSHTHDGFEVTFTIHAYSESPGRKEAMTIGNRIYQLLHGVDLGIVGFETVSCQEAVSRVLREDDGKTHHAFIQYQIILGGNPK